MAEMAEYDANQIPNLQETLDKIALENITSVTLNTDALKNNFEAIVSILKGLVKRVDGDQHTSSKNEKDIKDLKDRLEKLEDKQDKDKKELNEKIFNNENQIKTLDKQTNQNTDDIEKLQEALKEMRDNQNNLMDAHKNGQNDLNSIKEKLKEHDRQINDLLNRGSSGNNNNNNSRNQLDNGASDEKLNSLKDELDHLRTDMNDMRKSLEDQINELRRLLDDYVKKDEFNDYKDQTEKLLENFVKKDEFNSYKDQTDSKLQSHDDSIEDLYNKLNELTSKLSEKLDCENFDHHIADYNQIKALVLSLADHINNKDNSDGEKKVIIPPVQQVVPSGPALSTKDANLLKELGQRFPELENLVKKLQKDLSDHLVNYKVFSDDTNKKIQNGEDNLKNYKSENNKKIVEIEAALKSLREQLLNINLNASPSNKNAGSSSHHGGDHSADLRKIQITLNSLAERINNVEGEVSDLSKLREQVHHLQELTSENRNKINTIEDELIDLKGLKARVEILEQLLKELRDSSHKNKASRGSSFENVSPSGGVTLEQVRQLIDEEINKLRDELMALIEALRAALDKKADAEDLWKSEAALLEKLDQIAGALMKRAQADKNDTKKALMFLEKKIKEITVILMGGESKGEEGAIFAKKPWTPWSCASCDSKLKDYPGALIDHKHWNKLPQRETSPGRLTQGKFGKGWSKWADNKRMTGEKFAAGSAKGMGDTLPEINPTRGQQIDSSRLNE